MGDANGYSKGWGSIKPNLSEISLKAELSGFGKPTRHRLLLNVSLNLGGNDEKQVVSTYFKLALKRAPGLVQRAAAFGPIPLYRTEKVRGEDRIVVARVPDHALYFADEFFRVGHNLRMHGAGSPSYREWTFLHELTHLADSGWKLHTNVTWSDLIRPLITRVRAILKGKGMTWEEAFQAGLHDIARKEGLPSLYATSSKGETLPEYVAAIVLDDRFSAPAPIKAFIEKMLLSTPATPDYSMYYYNAGVIASSRGRIDEALTLYEKAITLDPNYGVAYYSRGQAWQKKKDLDNAISDFSRAIALLPYDQEIAIRSRFYRGEARRSKRAFDDALADFSEVIRLDPSHGEAYYNRGKVWEQKKEFDRAIADFSETIRQDPKFLPAYLDRGLIWREVKKDLDRAIADFSEATKVEPGDWRAHYNRGLAWRDKKDLDRAIADYGEAIKLLSEKDPFYGRVHFRRAELYLRGGKWTEAWADLEKGGWGRDVHVYYYVLVPGLIRERLGDMEGARKIWRERRQKPNDSWPWPLVDSLLGEKSEAEIFALIERAPAQERSGQRCEAYFYLGFHSLSRGNKQLAKDYYQRCLNEANADPTVKTYFEFDMAEAELRRIK